MEMPLNCFNQVIQSVLQAHIFARVRALWLECPCMVKERLGIISTEIELNHGHPCLPLRVSWIPEWG